MQRHSLKSENDLFQIEIEAMLTPQVRGYLKKLVLDNVDKHFDQKIYDEVQKELPSKRKVNRLVRSKMREFLG